MFSGTLSKRRYRTAVAKGSVENGSFPFLSRYRDEPRAIDPQGRLRVGVGLLRIVTDGESNSDVGFSLSSAVNHLVTVGCGLTGAGLGVALALARG